MPELIVTAYVPQRGKKSDGGKKGAKKGVFFRRKAHHNRTQTRSPIRRHCHQGHRGRGLSPH